jgi:fructose-1,6-bisphosphatase
MKATLKFEFDQDEPFERDELRKASNYSNAYYALYQVSQLLVRTREAGGNKKIIDELYREFNDILSNNNINLDKDVR